MPQTNVYLHQSVVAYLDLVATVVDTSRSEVVEMMIRYIKDNVDEGKVFDIKGLQDAIEDFQKALEEAEEEEGSESEDETEEESEEEEEPEEEEEE